MDEKKLKKEMKDLFVRFDLDNDVKYDGIQWGMGQNPFFAFTDLGTGSSFLMPYIDCTRKNYRKIVKDIKEKINNIRKKFGLKNILSKLERRNEFVLAAMLREAYGIESRTGARTMSFKKPVLAKLVTDRGIVTALLGKDPSPLFKTKYITIDPKKLRTLWYENEGGKKWDSPPDIFKEPPDGFIYQHSTFPNVIRHNVLRIVQRSEVDKCNHPSQYIVKTGGWIDGVKGRECTKCRGTQVVEEKDYPGDKWPDKWDAEGSRDFMTMESSWQEDLVLAIANSGNFTLGEAILITSSACERCMNALANYYGLSWGYAEGSKEWGKSNTKCDFCSKSKKNNVRK